MMILKPGKIIAFFFVLFALSHATVFDNYFNQKIDTSYDYYFSTDLAFPSGMTISTTDTGKVLSGTASDLASGSTVCPGTSLTIKPDVKIKWGSTSFAVKSLYPHPAIGGFTAPTACSVSGRTMRYGTWLTGTTFNSQKLIGTSGSASASSSDYNILQPFYSECVTYYDDVTSTEYKNSAGGANIYCKGNYSISGVGSGTLDNQNSLPPYTIYSTNTFAMSGSGLDCFAALYKQPSSPDFRIYYYAYNFGGSIAPASKTISVENRLNSIKCGPVVTSQPITVQPGSTALVAVTIQNTGGAPTKVVAVSASPSTYLKVDPFNTALCGSIVPASSAVCTGGNGFNSFINPGSSKTVYLMVSPLSGTAPGSYTTTLQFKYSTTYSVCNAQNPSTPCSLTNVVFNVGSGDNCTITDGSMPVLTGETRTFALQCNHQSGSLGPCSGSTVAWSASPSGFATIGSNDYQSANITFPKTGSGNVAATVTGGFNASCSFPSSGNITVQDVASCSVTPNPADVHYKQIHDFALTCYDSSNASTSCGSVSWKLQGLQGVFFAQSSTGASVGVHSSVGSKGKLNATIGAISCASDLTVVAQDKELEIQPESAKLKLNDTQPFTSTCKINGTIVPCLGMQWDPFSNLTGALSNSTNTGTTYKATVDNITTKLWGVASGLTPNPPYDWSDIVVGTGGGGGGNESGGGGGEEGESQDCKIINYHSFNFYVWCKESGGLKTCTKQVTWYFNSIPISGTSPSLMYLVTSSGKLTAEVDKGKTCYITVTPNPYSCLLYS